MFGTIKDFTADQFKPTKWEGSDKKAKFAKQFIGFIRWFRQAVSPRLLRPIGSLLRPYRPLQPGRLLRRVLHDH